MSELQDLEKMIAAPVLHTFGGKQIELKTLKVKQLPAVLKIVRPFIHLFSDKSNPVDIAGVLLDNTESAISLVSALTGEPEAWLGELDIDEMVLLFTAVVEVNVDFFIKRVFPSLTGSMERLGAVVGPVANQQAIGQSTSNT